MTVLAPAPPPDPARAGEAPEDGVIEDARERQRRHRRRGVALVAAAAGIAAVLIGALGGGGGGSGTLAGVQNHASSGQAGTQGSPRGSGNLAGVPGVVQFGLLAPGVGWVSDGSSVYLTRTGGRTWAQIKAVRPDAALGGSSSAESAQLAFSLADGALSSSCSHNTCRATATSPGTSASQRGQVITTTDAGLTWTARPLPGTAIPAALSYFSVRRGFALGYTPALHHDPRASLYKTDDGGRLWSRVAGVPFQGLLSFANARDGLGGGWALGAGLVDSADIYRTTDGGRTWIRTALCRPATVYSCEAPHLFASGRGVVLVTADDQQSRISQIEVDTTRNGGASWARHILPDTPAITDSQAYIPFSAPNSQDLFVWVSPYLYTSRDGGIDWTRRHEPTLVFPRMSPEFSQVAFINRRYGWFADGTIFDYTTDGGVHWTPVASQR